jgi:hypothetical protein
MGTSKNWFATAKLSEAEPEQARKVANNVLFATLSNELWRCVTANFVENEFLEAPLYE